MIKNIEIGKLYPHPDNPRQNVGDVTELAASIKANGIMQNLTVIEGGKGVPAGETGYTVIIGHRRLEAAKQAGLASVPCSVAEMSEKEQIATMLLENMQRSDLTLYEQAHGMQMMFDLGETETAISEKTGLSVSTVSRRLKIAKLDGKKLSAAESRGGTIDDYLKITEITNEKVRNKLLDEIGSNNFAWAFKRAKEEQTKAEKMPEIKKAMKKIGADRDPDLYRWAGGYETVYECALEKFSADKLPKKMPDKGLTWNIMAGDFLLRVKQPKQKSEGNKLTAKEKAVRKANGELTRLSKQAFELRRDFAQNFNSGKLYERELNEWSREILCQQITGDVYHARADKLSDWIPESKPAQYSYYINREAFESEKEKNSARLMLAVLLNRAGDNSEYLLFDHGYGESMPKPRGQTSGIHNVYAWLQKLGYPMSDMEKQLLDGTHPAFKGGEKK